MADPKMIRSEDQMCGVSLVMRLDTFKKLKRAAAGDDHLAWSNYVARLIEKAGAR